jgi:Rrf2 family protein
VLKLTRKTDLAVMLLSHLVGREEASSARDLARDLLLPTPTVSQILKRLAGAGLLVSERGVHGGYKLARVPATITLGDILRAIEKPLSLTMCSTSSEENCAHEGHCRARVPLQRVHLAMGLMFERLNLAELAGGAPARR